MTLPDAPHRLEADPNDDPAGWPAAQTREIALSHLVADVYEAATPPLRARLLECLLRPLHPLGLVAIAAGAFGGFLHRAHWTRFTVSLDDAVHYTSSQIFELARFVDQVQPEVFHQVAALLADNPVCVQTLSGSLLLLALRRWLPVERGERA